MKRRTDFDLGTRHNPRRALKLAPPPADQCETSTSHWSDIFLLDFPTWQRERFRLLRRLCRYIDAGQQKGKRFVPMIKRAARRYHLSVYKSDPSRKLALAPGTLIRIYYLWRNNGRADELLLQRFTAKLNHQAVTDLQKQAVQGGDSLKSVVRNLPTACTRSESYNAFLTPRQRRDLDELFAARRRVSLLERKLSRSIKARSIKK
jgi:hypothetical protein